MSHSDSRDKRKLVKALKSYSQLNLTKATNKDNAMIVGKYIDMAYICFYLRLYEGYEMINKVNSIPLAASELEKATKGRID